MPESKDIDAIHAAFEAALRVLLISGKRIHLYRLGFLELREGQLRRQKRDQRQRRVRVERGVRLCPVFEKCDDPNFLAASPLDYVSETDIVAAAFPFLPERLRSQHSPLEISELLKAHFKEMRESIDDGALYAALFSLGFLVVNPSRVSVDSDYFGQREISFCADSAVVEFVNEVFHFTPPSLYYFFEIFEAGFGPAAFKVTADSILPQSQFAPELRSVVISAWYTSGSTRSGNHRPAGSQGEAGGVLYVTDGVRKLRKSLQEFSVFVPLTKETLAQEKSPGQGNGNTSANSNASVSNASLNCALWPALTLVRALECVLARSGTEHEGVQSERKFEQEVLQIPAGQIPAPGGGVGFLALEDELLPGGALVASQGNDGSEEIVQLLRLTPLLPEELQLLGSSSIAVLRAVLSEKGVLGFTAADRRPVTLRGLQGSRQSSEISTELVEKSLESLKENVLSETPPSRLTTNEEYAPQSSSNLH